MTPISPQRLLFVRNDRVGDLILTLPAIEAARNHWPDARITVLTSRVAALLLEDYPTIDQLLIDDPRESCWRLGKRLRAEKFDTAIVARNSWRNMLAVKLAGIPRRVVWGRKLPGLLLGTHRLMVSRSRPPIHEADYVNKLVGLLHPTLPAANYEIHLQSKDDVLKDVAARIAHLLGEEGPLFAINPSNFRGAYNWPLAKFAALTEALTSHGRVLVTMGPMEQEVADQFRRLLPAGVAERVAVVNDFDLRQLSAAFELADVVTSANTGPMHLAGALDRPLVALFSAHPAQSPAKWRPLGSQHLILKAPLLAGEAPTISPDRAEEHMARISVEEVVAANLQQLKIPQKVAA